MLTGLRRAVQAHLAAVSTWRKPALRRTDDPDALLMTDLPRAAGEEAVNAFCAAMEAENWRIRRAEGWLLLDHDVPAPSWDALPVMQGEAGCCLSLLMRHGPGETPPEAVRALVKAAEAGPAALERLCGRWHGEWARCLREHRPLPGGLIPYLCAALPHEPTMKEVSP